MRQFSSECKREGESRAAVPLCLSLLSLRLLKPLTGLGRALSTLMPRSFAGSRTVIDQLGFEIVAFQLGYSVIFVLGAIEFDRRATIGIKNHQNGSRGLIARTDFAGFVGIPLRPCKPPKANSGECFTAHLAFPPSESRWRCGESANRAKIRSIYISSARTITTRFNVQQP